MKHSKVDFIADLLHDKRVSSSNKERLFLLAQKELRDMSITDHEILDKLQKLEDHVYGKVTSKPVKQLEPEGKNISYGNQYPLCLSSAE